MFCKSAKGKGFLKMTTQWNGWPSPFSMWMPFPSVEAGARSHGPLGKCHREAKAPDNLHSSNLFQTYTYTIKSNSNQIQSINLNMSAKSVAYVKPMVVPTSASALPTKAVPRPKEPPRITRLMPWLPGKAVVEISGLQGMWCKRAARSPNASSCGLDSKLKAGFGLLRSTKAIFQLWKLGRSRSVKRNSWQMAAFHAKLGRKVTT